MTLTLTNDLDFLVRDLDIVGQPNIGIGESKGVNKTKNITYIYPVRYKTQIATLYNEKI